MKTIEYSISEAEAVRHLIVCDTQFTCAGVTNLTRPQMMDLQVRGWVVEGDSNDEFQLTEAGEAVVARALEHGALATLATAKHGGCVQLGEGLLPCPFCGNGAEFVPYKNNGLTLKCKSMGCIQRHQRTLRYGIEWLRTSMTEHWNARARSAQPSPGGQGEALAAFVRLAEQRKSELGELSPEMEKCLQDGVQALAARQPVGEPVGYLFTDDPAVYAMPGSGFHSGAEPPKNAINVVPVYAGPTQAVDLWQPIETAPKNGSSMLLGHFNSAGNWRTMRGRWFSAEKIEMEWENADDFEAGWYEESVEADDIPSVWPTTPTYWQPLPAAPSVDSQAVGNG